MTDLLPSSAEALQNGQRAMEQGDLQGAITFFEHALQAEPNSVHLLLALFQVYQRLGDVNTSLLYLTKGFEAAPELFDITTKKTIIEIYLGRGEATKALEVNSEITRQEPDRTEHYEKAAQIWLALGDLLEAESCYAQCIALNPSLSEIGNQNHVNLGFPFKIERLRGSKAFLKKIHLRNQLTSSVNALSSNSSIRDALELGKSGRLSRAIDSLNGIAAHDENYSYARFWSSVFYSVWAQHSGRGDLSKRSLDILNELRNSGSQRADVFYLLGCAVRGQGFDESMTLHQKAIEIDPRHLDAIAETFDMLQRLGRWDEAFVFMKRHRAVQKELQDASPLSALPIRFFREFAYAIGHLAFFPEVIVKMEELGWSPKRHKIMIAPPHVTSNQCLLDYWKRYFTILTDQKSIEQLGDLADVLEEDNGKMELPNGQVLSAPAALSQIQIAWEAERRGPILSIDPDHARRGWDVLKRWGLKEGDWFVTVHNREGGFKNEGECLHNLHRNADITSFSSAIDAIVKAGGWVIRLGENTSKKLLQQDRVIDYAHTPEKSDWMDIFLCVECRYFLGTSAGVISVPQLFGRPLVAVNFPPATIQHGSRDIMIPKLMWSTDYNRLLTFREMYSQPLIHNQEGAHFHKWGIRFVDNTAEEILQASDEMFGRLTGEVVYTDEDNQLQEKFRQLIAPQFGKMSFRIGREFLKKYSALLA